MPVDPNATIEITAYQSVPDMARGFVSLSAGNGGTIGGFRGTRAGRGLMGRRGENEENSHDDPQ
jgi:hypothetical protein